MACFCSFTIIRYSQCLISGAAYNLTALDLCSYLYQIQMVTELGADGVKLGTNVEVCAMLYQESLLKK